MGKRGPKPSDGYGDKTRVLSTRISREVRSALDDARKRSGRTISSEVEYRLRRSFDEDADITERFGGRSVYAILRMVAAALTMAGDVAVSTRTGKLGSPEQWLLDAFAYDQAMKATVTVLEAFRPAGKPTPPKMKTVLKAHGKKAPPGKSARAFDWAVQRLGTYAAFDMRATVAEAPQTIPPPHVRTSRGEELARKISTDLGETLRSRLKEASK